MNIGKKLYYDKGVVIKLAESEILMIYPDNVENNLNNLSEGNLVINWNQVLHLYKHLNNENTKYELKITIYGKVTFNVIFENFEGLELFTSNLDNGALKIQWLELLKLAKGE